MSEMSDANGRLSEEHDRRVDRAFDRARVFDRAERDAAIAGQLSADARLIETLTTADLTPAASDLAPLAKPAEDLETGWFVDPYGRHEARWISAGHPTDLVRDGGADTLDPAPDEPMPRPLRPVAETEVPADVAMLRADASTRVDQTIAPESGPRAVLDVDGGIGLMPRRPEPFEG